jgi:hypothetical protein
MKSNTLTYGNWFSHMFKKSANTAILDYNGTPQNRVSNILLSPSLVTGVLFSGLVLLVVINICVTLLYYAHGQSDVHGFARVFSLDGERNIPTAYNVFLLLLPAALIGLIGYLTAKETKSFPWYWAILAFGFCFMAMDEAWTIHEDLIGPVRQAAFGNHSAGIFYNAWVIPAIGLVAVLGLFFLRFLFLLDVKTRIAFVVAGAIYLFGVLGMEMIDSSYLEAHGKTFTYKLMTIAEETFEMSGLILFVRSLLVYLKNNFKSISFSFQNKAEDTVVVQTSSANIKRKAA